MKRFYCISFPLLCFMLCSILLVSSTNFAIASPLNVKSCILLDLDTVEVLYSQNADKKIPPASLTKVMTMYIVFDAINDKKLTLDTKVKVSKKAANTPGSSMGLRTGEVVTIKQLLQGMAVASGNDACVAIAEHMAGSEAKFTKLMNAKARKLKMTNTVFKTANGLPAQGQYTTARDMLHLSRNYIMIHPNSLKYHSMQSLIHNGRKIKNSHPQLGKYRGADGLKTGYTRASGYNIISTSRQGKTRLIAVMLGANTAQIRAKELNRLMNAGFAYRKNSKSSMQKLLGTK